MWIFKIVKNDANCPNFFLFLIFPFYVVRYVILQQILYFAQKKVIILKRKFSVGLKWSTKNVGRHYPQKISIKSYFESTKVVVKYLVLAIILVICIIRTIQNCLNLLF